jgi:hemoglobin/transferrin/lactoferrin receptor protein
MSNAARLFLVAALASAITHTAAQTVSVRDAATGAPLERVVVYTPDQSKLAITNDEGKARIDAFSSGDRLVFRQLGYSTRTVAYDSLAAFEFVVGLRARSYATDEVVVSANRWETKRSDAPQEIAAVSSDRIAFEAPQTSADALATTGKVFVQKSQLGGGSPMLRGFAANGVLIVVDGVRMNNAIYRGGNLQNVILVDPNNLARAEVVFGPGSVMYGGDALGGVMAFHTRKPVYSADGFETFGSAFARYSSANEEKTAHADFNLGAERFASYTGVTVSDFSDLRAGNLHDLYDLDFGRRHFYVERVGNEDVVRVNDDPNIQTPSGYRQYNILHKMEYALSDALEFGYRFHHSSSGDIPRYDRLTETRDGAPRYAEWYYGPQRWTMHVLESDLTEPTPLYNKIKTSLAFQSVEESRHDRKFQSDELRSRVEKVDVYSLNVDAFRYVSEQLQWFYGADAAFNRVASSARSENIATGAVSPEATRYPDGGSDYLQWGAYARVAYRLGDATTASAGARYSRTTLDATIARDFYDLPFDELSLDAGALTWSAGVATEALEGWRLYANVSSGFRAPNVDDVAKVFDSEPGAVVAPNDDLGPEYAYTAEGGVVKYLGESAALELTTYYTLVEDVIVRRDYHLGGRDSIMYDGELSAVKANVNAGEAYVFGASASLTADLTEALSLSSSLAYCEGRDKTANEPLRHTPPLFGRTSIGFHKSGWRLEASVEYQGAKPFDDLAPSEQEKTHMYASVGSPAWYALDARASYDFAFGAVLSVGVENVMDAHYRPYGWGISAPGRNLVVSARASF